MEIMTHRNANTWLLGKPIRVDDDYASEVELKASKEMAVDRKGLVHGGFTFGLADYAAMLAVNHPNVVLGKSECRFIEPVRIGETMRAKAEITEKEGKRRSVKVDVNVDDRKVFNGYFTCYILDKHVLEK